MPAKCQCGECRKCRQRAVARAWYLRNRELTKARAAQHYAENQQRHIETNREWQRRNAERSREIKREWNYRNREKTKAHHALNNAIRAGSVDRQDCEICGRKADAHHDDYSKPLEVRWFCHAHHMELHRSAA